MREIQVRLTTADIFAILNMFGGLLPADFLSKYFNGTDDPNQFLLNILSSVNIEKPIPIPVGVQIELQRPDAPE